MSETSDAMAEERAEDYPLLPIPELMRQLALHRTGDRGVCTSPRPGGRICGRRIVGYETKKYCSDYCKLAASRARRRSDTAGARSDAS